jgi:hypothetical protein
LAAPTLEVSGACPGVLSFTVEGLTGPFALFSAMGPGSAEIPDGPCTELRSGLSPSGFAFRGVHPSDASGIGRLSPTIPSAACSAFVQVVDLATCDMGAAREIGGRAPVEVEFPSPTSTLHTGEPLGEGGGGKFYELGDHVSQTFDGTVLGSVSAIDATFDMDDFTKSECAVGRLDFDVSINDVVVGTYGYEGGGFAHRIGFEEHLEFDPVPGTGPGGDSYTVRFAAAETVCLWGGSWNWFAHGSLVLHP